jgi:probable phosphoglycerate mutase
LTTTRIYLVRHGATTATTGERFSGAENVELTEEGRRQATCLGDRLHDERISAAYSSPLSRAMETARLIAERCSLAIEASDALREISHGRWEGLTRREVATRFPDELAAWEADPFRFAPEGGETGAAVLERAAPALHEIVARHPSQRVLVVSHKATIRLLLCGLLGIDPRGYRDRLDLSPASVNVLEFHDPAQVRLMLFNDTSHYAAPLRTVP